MSVTLMCWASAQRDPVPFKVATRAPMLQVCCSVQQCHKPVVWYKGFLYQQAANWKTAHRVAATVEFHLGRVISPCGLHRDQPGEPTAGQWCGSTTRLERKSWFIIATSDKACLGAIGWAI